MRIVAGRFKGASLATPKSDATRPTSDRLRETIFNILLHGVGADLEGARVLDLFAGTGALGFEAISRGAKHATFVEEGTDARGVIRRNMEAFGLNGAAKILRRDATKLGAAGTIEPFDLLFADPPMTRASANWRWRRPEKAAGWQMVPSAFWKSGPATRSRFRLASSFSTSAQAATVRCSSRAISPPDYGTVFFGRGRVRRKMRPSRAGDLSSRAWHKPSSRGDFRRRRRSKRIAQGLAASTMTRPSAMRGSPVGSGKGKVTSPASRTSGAVSQTRVLI